MSFTDLAKKRCSIRAYETKPVESEKIAAIVEAAHVAPSAANRQPVRLIQVKARKDSQISEGTRTFTARRSRSSCAQMPSALGSAPSTAWSPPPSTPPSPATT